MNITQQFLSALQFSHRISTTGQALVNGALTGPMLPVLNGKITIDRKNDWRRTCSVTLVDDTGTLVPPPSSQNGTLSPYGNEVAFFRTIEGFPPVPLGVFGIVEAKVTDAPTTFTIDISGNDRAYHVSIQDWSDAYVILAETNVNSAIQTIVQDRFSTFTPSFNFPPTTATTPLMLYGLNSGDDPWQVGEGLAYTIGNQLFFDPNGICTQSPWPNPTAQPTVWTLQEGPTCIITQIERDLTSKSVPNWIIALAEGSGITTPLRADAQITDPTNPLYVNGPYGAVPKFVTTNQITDQATLQSYANAQLLSYAGAQEQITVECIANPLLDVNDVVYIQRARSNIATRYIVTSIDLPLEPETPMTFSANLAVGIIAS